jgi:hypothetical protein
MKQPPSPEFALRGDGDDPMNRWPRPDARPPFRQYDRARFEHAVTRSASRTRQRTSGAETEALAAAAAAVREEGDRVAQDHRGQCKQQGHRAGGPADAV